MSDFPEPPPGSPGGVRQAARSLAEAGRGYEGAASRLSGASGALRADWQGWAADSYMACTDGIAARLRTGVSVFEACEKALSSFADALDHAQDEIRRLRGLYDDARARQAQAAIAIVDLGADLIGAKPAEVDGIQDRIDAAATQESRAGDEAERLRRRAEDVLQRFKEEERAAADVLEGDTLATSGALGAGLMGGGVGGGLSGPGFGVPAGGLAPLTGVITVQHPNRTEFKGPGEWVFGGFGSQTKIEQDTTDSTNVPGFQNFWEAREGHSVQALEDDNSLINPVFLLSGGVASLGGRMVTRGASSLLAGAAGSRQTAGQVAPRFFSDEAAAQGLKTSINGMGRGEAQDVLKQMGVPDQYARRAAESFEDNTARVVVAGSDDYAIRFHGRGSDPVGHFAQPTFEQGAVRARSALPPGNSIENVSQFRIPEGTVYLEGRIAPKFGQPGGGMQYYFPDKKVLEPLG